MGRHGPPALAMTIGIVWIAKMRAYALPGGATALGFPRIKSGLTASLPATTLP